jgi:hypothetical protein
LASDAVPHSAAETDAIATSNDDRSVLMDGNPPSAN